MRELQIADLETFSRLAELGTLSATAHERGVPVSQVSRQLARIEAAVGTRLVHRSTKGLALTVQGRVFLDYCRRLLQTTDEVEGEFAAHSREIKGSVRVAASVSVAEHVLVPSLAPLTERHPGLHIELQVGARLVDVSQPGVDIAIRSVKDLPGTTVARRIGTLSRRLYAAPSYLQRHGVPRHPDELQLHALITNTNVPTLDRWPFIVDGQKRVFLAKGRWRTNDAHIVAVMARQGLGIARLATLVGDPLLADGVLEPILPDHIDVDATPLYAVTAATRHRLPKLRACIDFWSEWLRR
jgi:DNA-binding transcriptional LysR family regulator